MRPCYIIVTWRDFRLTPWESRPPRESPHIHEWYAALLFVVAYLPFGVT